MGPLPPGGQRGLSLGFGGQFHDAHEIESAPALWVCNFIALKNSTAVSYRMRGNQSWWSSDTSLPAYLLL